MQGIAFKLLPLILTNNNRNNLEIVAKGKYLPTLKELSFMLLTFSFTAFAWIFFRAENLESSVFAISKIFQFNLSLPIITDTNVVVNSILMLCIGLLFDCYLYFRKVSLEDLGSKFSLTKIVIFCTIITIIINLFHSNSDNFIYFQF